MFAKWSKSVKKCANKGSRYIVVVDTQTGTKKLFRGTAPTHRRVGDKARRAAASEMAASDTVEGKQKGAVLMVRAHLLR
jgi:hypothetical protein